MQSVCGKVRFSIKCHLVFPGNLYFFFLIRGLENPEKELNLRAITNDIIQVDFRDFLPLKDVEVHLTSIIPSLQ